MSPPVSQFVNPFSSPQTIPATVTSFMALLPFIKYALPFAVPGAPIITSSKPSPPISRASETDQPKRSPWAPPVKVTSGRISLGNLPRALNQ